MLAARGGSGGCAQTVSDTDLCQGEGVPNPRQSLHRVRSGVDTDSLAITSVWRGSAARRVELDAAVPCLTLACLLAAAVGAWRLRA